MWYKYDINDVHDKYGTYDTCEMLYTSNIDIDIDRYVWHTWYMLYI